MNDTITTILSGIARGITVHTVIYPLEVIKIRQQSLPFSEKSYKIAWNLFQNEGLNPFYKGLPPKLFNTIIKQTWVWPTITNTPSFLNRHGIKKTQQLPLTGLLTALIDASISTPLERIKILAANTGKIQFSLKDIYKDGWKGFWVNLTKLSVNWVTFLVVQKHLRERGTDKNKTLHLSQLTLIGTQVAIIVSLVSAPFDLANTLKHTQNLKATDLLSQKEFRRLYRGWPLSMLSLTIHNIASVIVIHKLEEKFPQK